MRSKSPLIALSSLAILLLAGVAAAASRPRYGGTLKVEVRAQVRSVDPVQEPWSVVTPLIYDTLVELDASNHPQASLAVSWTEENEHRVRLTLRRGIRFSDGTPMSATLVSASLRNANPDWTLRDVGDVVIIETDQPVNLLAQLALPRNAIVLRIEDKLVGTGPFVLVEWQAGARAVVQAREDGWRSRPFLDRVEMQFGRGMREQALDLDLGRTDLIEVAPEEAGRPSGRRMVRSDPVVLLAIRFSHTNPAVRDARTREAVSLAIDRESIANILLQRRGEAAGGLLPNWLTGYSFLFPTRPQIGRARQLRVEAKATAPMTLVYRAADPVARLIAERIALNAADAGLTVRTAPDTQGITVPDMELLAIRLPSTDPATSLEAMSRPGILALPYVAPVGDSADAGYRATTAALKDTWAAPIAYAPVAYALSSRVANWIMSRTGEWRLESVSVAPVEVAKP